MSPQRHWWQAATLCLACLLSSNAPGQQQFRVPQEQGPQGPPSQVLDPIRLGKSPLVHQVVEANERLEMIVNTSRILTLGTKIPKVQVNNPEILKITPLSPTQVQISAIKAGVTQVNMWDESENIYSVDVIVIGDARELQMLLETQFPTTSLQVLPLANSVVISGFVTRPETVSQVVEIAQDYYPKVINAMRVGGVQQVLLHVKVMEVSRTKLRQLGVDFLQISRSGAFVHSGISGVLGIAQNGGAAISDGTTLSYALTSGGDTFFSALQALRQHNLAKILAEPDLVTVSGRAASFNVGGEFPVPIPQSLGTISIEYKKFGTQIDFVPIVLGEGKIKLEVRPRVSEIDATRSVTINETEVPGLRVREVDTGVEMRAGQTLAIAGLVQTRTEAVNRGLPWASDLPYVGALFRRVEEETNEIELLILVTPELVDAMDCDEVPPGGPGLYTTSPSDHELYWKGKLEVPRFPGPVEYGGQGEYLPGMITDEVPGEVVPAPQGQAPAGGPAPSGDATGYRGRSPQAVRTRPAAKRQTSRSPQNRSTWHTARPERAADGRPGLIGPVGYDVSK